MISRLPTPSLPNGSRRQWLLRLLALLLALTLFGVLWRTVEWLEVWAHLASLRAGEVALLLGINTLVFSTFSLRWWLLLAAQGYRLPYQSLMGYRLAAFSLSYFTPGSHFGGEPLQVYLVSKGHAVPIPVSLSAVLLDKLLEVLANFTFLLVGAIVIAWQGFLPSGMALPVLLSGVTLLSLLSALFAAMMCGKQPISALLRRSDPFWQRTTGRRSLLESNLYRILLDSDVQSAHLFRSQPHTLWLLLGASLLSWLAMIGEFWLMTRVLGLNLTLSQAILALVAARIAILLPLPGAVGVLEGSQALVMTSLGLPPAFGVSLSLLIRARDILFGLIGLAVGAWSWRRGDKVKR